MVWNQVIWFLIRCNDRQKKVYCGAPCGKYAHYTTLFIKISYKEKTGSSPYTRRWSFFGELNVNICYMVMTHVFIVSPICGVTKLTWFELTRVQLCCGLSNFTLFNYGTCILSEVNTWWTCDRWSIHAWVISYKL